ncbi:MAG: hypothetical protein KIT09_26685 [Bryobacteraceae bacterium]|nr:hypothetical protein [Bryobacteraceae bacterium]
MPLRIRPWHLAIAVIVLCAAAISALYLQRIRSAGALEALLRRLPPGEAGVLYVDVQALRAAGVLQALARAENPPEVEYREFVEQSGFDYAKDLDAVLASFQGDETFFLLRGRFDWGRLVGFVTSRGGDCYNGFCRTRASGPNRWISFFAVTPSIMAMAVSRDVWAVDSMLVERTVQEILEIPSEPVWLTVAGKTLNRVESLPAGTRAFVSALTTARRITLALGGAQQGYQAILHVDCGTEREAREVAEQLTAVTAVLRQMIRLENKTPNARDLSGVLAGGEFRSTGLRVEGRWSIHQEFIEAISGGTM